MATCYWRSEALLLALHLRLQVEILLGGCGFLQLSDLHVGTFIEVGRVESDTTNGGAPI